MSEQANHKCECGSAKKMKALESQIIELTELVAFLSHKVEILERAMKR